jgi:hypothetical protein
MGLALGCVTLVAVWPNWRDAYAEGYYNGYDEASVAVLACAVSTSTGTLDVELSDSSGPDALTFAAGTPCTDALLGYSEEGWTIRKEDQILVKLQQGIPIYVNLYRLNR